MAAGWDVGNANCACASMMLPLTGRKRGNEDKAEVIKQPSPAILLLLSGVNFMSDISTSECLLDDTIKRMSCLRTWTPCNCTLLSQFLQRRDVFGCYTSRLQRVDNMAKQSRSSAT
jgi:hypothetical protein